MSRFYQRCWKNIKNSCKFIFCPPRSRETQDSTSSVPSLGQQPEEIIPLEAINSFSALSLDQVTLEIVLTHPIPLETSKILMLPQELLDKILEHIPTLDRARLALTCKTLYIRSRSACRALDFKNALPSETQPHLVPVRTKNPMIKFALGLETPRWKFCFSCNRLHPRSAWTDPRSFQEWDHLCISCGERTLVTPFKMPRREYACMPHAGLVDLCPCFSITLPCRTELVEALKRAGLSKYLDGGLESMNRRGVGNMDLQRLYCSFFNREGRNDRAYHECTAEGRLSGTPLMTGIFRVGEELWVESSIPMDSDEEEEIEELGVHERGQSWEKLPASLRRLHASIGIHAFWPNDARYTVSKSVASLCSDSESESSTYRLVALRNLGAGDTMDEEWKRHRWVEWDY